MLVLFFFCLKMLTELTAYYFRSSENSGECSVCVSVAAFSFLFTMILLLFSDRLLAVEIQDGGYAVGCSCLCH
ncbi:unnamed protein product [Soboliphyme baturini]|uniref:Secreted protein n=1 Tax=Soboliphyme baturini TaxID=241478 RepID=A0A183IDY9_9BILA|nr:unnamed protein product [Soboliphyme baturini]